MRRLPIYIICLPVDLFVWIYILILHVACGARLYWKRGLWLVMSPDAPITQKYYYLVEGRCFGHGGYFTSEPSESLEYHEINVHGEQYESHMLTGFVSACLIALGWILLESTGVAIAAVIIWLGASRIAVGCASLVAMSLGEDGYMGSHLEEAAYSREKHTNDV